MVFHFTVSDLCWTVTTNITICYAQNKGKKACGSEWQKGSVHMGFCNCARAVVHVALNILSVVDETVCLQFDNCVPHSSPRNSTIALPLVPEFQGQRKIKEKGGEKKI